MVVSLVPVIIQERGVYRIIFKSCEWRWFRDRDFIETIFWDRRFVAAAPEYARDLPTARDYGYADDVVTLFVHHDLAHTVVMQALGYDVSPTLHHVANGERISDEWRCTEECLIAEFQRYLNGGPVPTRPSAFARLPAEPDWAAMRRDFLLLLDTRGLP
jgi:hypothetical protein